MIIVSIIIVIITILLVSLVEANFVFIPANPMQLVVL